MSETTINFTTFPNTEPPPPFIAEIVTAFRKHEQTIATEVLERHTTSDKVLATLANDLLALGFRVETGKSADQIIDRPVFFGENGRPTLRFEVDAYHDKWRCGLEIEAIRCIRGGAFYRDLIQALVMVGIDHLCIAVPNKVVWGKSGRSRDYSIACSTARALFGHSRVAMPYGLTVIGY